jgi:hypothetical protein
MDMYAKLKDLDERVQAGEMKLLEVLDELRLMRADKLTRTQIEAATKPLEPEPVLVHPTWPPRPVVKVLEARLDQVEVDVAAALAGTEPVILNADQPSEEDRIVLSGTLEVPAKDEPLTHAEIEALADEQGVLEGDDAVDEPAAGIHTNGDVDAGHVERVTIVRTPEKRRPGRPARK